MLHHTAWADNRIFHMGIRSDEFQIRGSTIIQFLSNGHYFKRGTRQTCGKDNGCIWHKLLANQELCDEYVCHNRTI